MAKMLVLSVRQAAQVCEVTEKTLRKWVADGTVASRKGLDGFTKIPLSQLKKKVASARYELVKKRLENGDDPLPPEKKAPAQSAKPAKPVNKAPCKDCGHKLIEPDKPLKITDKMVKKILRKGKK